MHEEERKRLAPRLNSKKKPVFWCEVCRGLLKPQDKCVICGQKTSDIKKYFPEVVDHCRYIQTTYKKLLKFQQPTTGVSAVDEEVKSQHGLVKPVHKVIAEICEYKGKYYCSLYYDKRICESGDTEVEAKRNLAILANSRNQLLPVYWKDYTWIRREYGHKAIPIGSG